MLHPASAAPLIQPAVTGPAAKAGAPGAVPLRQLRVFSSEGYRFAGQVGATGCAG